MRIATLVAWRPRALSRWLLLAGICVLAFAALIDPADQIFHLKVPAFALVVAVAVWRRGLGKPTIRLRTSILVIAFSFVIPGLWTLLGMMRWNVHGPDYEFGAAKAFLFLLLVPVLIAEDIDFAALVIRIGALVAGLTFVMVIASFVFPPAFAALYSFSLQKNNAIISESRDLLGIGVGQFYYKTSALLVFPLAYYCSRAARPGSGRLRALLLCGFYAAALLFSGARANDIGGLLIMGAFAALWLVRKAGWLPAFAFAVAGAILFSSTVAVKMTNPHEESNSIKRQHLHSYAQEFDAHPSILLWGQGADRAFYTEGFGDWTTTTELSYLELVRLFGVPVTAMFLAGLVCLSGKLFADRRLALGIAFVAYLVMSGSNPLLISSTGLLAICAVWKEVDRPSGPASAFHLPEADLALAESAPLLRISPGRRAASIQS